MTVCQNSAYPSSRSRAVPASPSPVVLHIGFAQALPERGDPFRRRVLRQQALPEAPEGSGVGLCLFRNRNMEMHQAASRQQPGTQQG